MPPEQALRKAKPDAERAVQLDGTSAEAHAALACVRYLYQRDSRGAATEFQRAIELCPNCAPAHQWYGNYLCNQERFEECEAETARAHALDPAYLVAAVDVGIRLYDARRYGEAMAPIQKVLEFNPDFTIGHRYLGQVYEANRMYRDAVEELRKAIDLSGGAPIDLGALGNVYAVLGDRASARKALNRLDDLARERYVSGYERTLIWAGLGENDRALESLEQAFQEHSSWMTELKVDARLDPLRGSARFADLTRRVGLTP
jgi:tetratricopeptide (TPR) repeat protein